MNKRAAVRLCIISVLLVLFAIGCGPSSERAGMAGFWADPDNNVTTIEKQGDSFTAVSVYNLSQTNSQNTLVSSLYAYRVLTWRYCPPAKPCLTLQTKSLNGDSLDVSWQNENGEKGTMTLQRVDKGSN